MNQKTSKVEKEFYLRCSYLTLSVLFDKEPIYSGSRTRTYDIMINSHALLPTELCRNQVHEYNINFF